MRNLRRVLMRLMRLLRRNNLVSPLHSHGRMCRHRIVVVLPSAQGLITRWFSLILPQRPLRKPTSPPSLDVREYVHTYISQQINSSWPSFHTLGKTKYHSPWFTIQVLMSHSIHSHCVRFHFFTVRKREIIWHKTLYESDRSSKSSPIFRRCLTWCWRIYRPKSQKNRFKSNNSTANISIFTNRLKRINTLSIA